MTEYIDFFNRDVMGIVQVLTGLYFFGRLLQKRGKIYFYLLAALMWLAVMNALPSGRAMEFLAFILLLVLSGTAVYHADLKAAVLYAALAVEVMQLSYGIVNNLLGILYPHMSSFDPYVVGTVFAVFGNVALLPAVLCYRAICRYFSYYEMIEKRYVLTVLIPILMIFLMGEYINYVMVNDLNIMDGSEGSVYQNHYLMLVIQLFGMASLFCIMAAYKKLLQNFRLQTELSLLEQEEHSLHLYVEEAKANYEKTKAFRHDIRNHMTVMKELLSCGQSEEALRYITDMEGMTKELSFPCSTNNPVVDILMRNKLGLAKNMGIDADCRLVLPSPCPVRDIDLCVILSNALDNAIHACKKMDDDAERYICVTGHMQGDFMLLEIENSYDGQGFIRQGTGLSNIKAVAEKYQGTMSIQTRGMVFTLSALLIIKQHLDDSSRQKTSSVNTGSRKRK